MVPFSPTGSPARPASHTAGNYRWTTISSYNAWEISYGAIFLAYLVCSVRIIMKIYCASDLWHTVNAYVYIICCMYDYLSSPWLKNGATVLTRLDCYPHRSARTFPIIWYTLLQVSILHDYLIKRASQRRIFTTVTVNPLMFVVLHDLGFQMLMQTLTWVSHQTWHTDQCIMVFSQMVRQ